MEDKGLRWSVIGQLVFVPVVSYAKWTVNKSPVEVTFCLMVCVYR